MVRFEGKVVNVVFERPLSIIDFSKDSTFNRNVLKFLQTGRLMEQYA